MPRKSVWNFDAGRVRLTMVCLMLMMIAALFMPSAVDASEAVGSAKPTVTDGRTGFSLVSFRQRLDHMSRVPGASTMDNRCGAGRGLCSNGFNEWCCPNNCGCGNYAGVCTSCGRF